MSELRDLYQEVIVDHSRHPRNFREGGAEATKADGYNPLCGDRVTIWLEMDGDRVKDVSFRGNGCAISTASASLLTEVLRGKSRDEAERLFTSFHDLVTGKGGTSGAELGKLAVFAGVQEYPARVKCASLAWHTMKNALAADPTPAKTE